jgi:hypothetical protein
MHRRPLGRGRIIAVVAAAVLIVACLLPWYGVGGRGGLPALDLRAFDGTGILTFIAALVTLALVSLPYAVGDRPVSADRPVAYLLLLGVALVGVVLWPLDLLGESVGGLLPDRAPGFWLAIGGVVIYGRATFDIFTEQLAR